MFDIVYSFLLEFITSMGWYIPILIVLVFLGYLVFGGRK